MFGDSDLVIKGVKREWRVKHPNLIPLFVECSSLCIGLDVTFKWIPREENDEADKLTR